MNRIKLYVMSLLATVTMLSCGKDYDDSALRRDIEMKTRIELLENWCSTANTQISALQGLINALQQNDYVTGVTPIMEGAKEVGYTITFTQSKPITILHGKDDAKGVDGITPIIGVQKAEDGLYYWTVQTGAATEWLTDDKGNKIPVTAQDDTPGKTPEISVCTFEGKLYWKVNGEWLMSGGLKVPATGDKGETGSAGPQGATGDAIFKKDGIEIADDGASVTFTLTNGTTITLPMNSVVTIAFDSYDTFCCDLVVRDVPLILPLTLKKDDYTSIVATVTNEKGIGTDVSTRSAATSDVWGVKIVEPSFNTDGSLKEGSAKITLTPPHNIQKSDVAVLRVTITDKNGIETSISRPICYLPRLVIYTEAGQLSTKNIPDNTTELVLRGSLNDDDFYYLKNNILKNKKKNVKKLNLSMTDVTELPDQAINTAGSSNEMLEEVILPDCMVTIGASAFYGCKKLTKIYMENVQTIGSYAFSACTGMTEIKLPETVTSIEGRAFYNCYGLERIEIPSSVKTLGSYMFEACLKLKTIILHEGLENISDNTFYKCGVTSIHIPTTVKVISRSAFDDCKDLKEVILHDDIETMKPWAFDGCISLPSVSIPTGLTAISIGAFNECTALHSVTLHNDVVELGRRAFFKTGLTSIDLPAKLEMIGDSAFYECPRLTNMNCYATSVPALGKDPFKGIKPYTILNVLKSLEPYKAYDSWSAYFKEIRYCLEP